MESNKINPITSQQQISVPDSDIMKQTINNRTIRQESSFDVVAGGRRRPLPPLASKLSPLCFNFQVPIIPRFINSVLTSQLATFRPSRHFDTSIVSPIWRHKSRHRQLQEAPRRKTRTGSGAAYQSALVSVCAIHNYSFCSHNLHRGGDYLNQIRSV
jgi:hypothetical protein